MGANPSRRKEKEDKEFNRDLKSKDKKNSKDKIHYYKCKGLGHMMHEYRHKDRDQDPKGKKVL